MAPRDEKTVDNIFAGCLDNLPPLSSKVISVFNSVVTICHEILRLFAFSPARPSRTCWWRETRWWSGFTQRSRNTARSDMALNFKWEQELHSRMDKSWNISGCGHEVGSQRRDDKRAYDHSRTDRMIDNCVSLGSLYEWAERLSEVQHGTEFHLLWRPEVRLQANSLRDRDRGVDEAYWSAWDDGKRCHPFEEVVQEG